ncbi:MAG TPA: SET domain-containing protein [Candidatus Doudnabacteria bacterium]|nr:SET domain-containing protein [Candidatus Doudnabacteria bacterium]
MSKTQDLRAQLVVKRSVAGLGLFTTKPIKKGVFIIEYVGPLLNEEQVQKKGGKYLFALGKTWTIDGSSRRNIARYINHSCVRTNCEPIQYAKRIKLRATRNIKTGEELFYDYGKEYFDEFLGRACRCPKHQKKVHKQ